MEESVSTWVTSVSHSITAPSLIWVGEKNTPDGGKGGKMRNNLDLSTLKLVKILKNTAV